jgi:hypothetical protein
LRDVFDIPDFIQNWRARRSIAAQVAAHGGEGWLFRAPPQDRLDAFLADLARLTDSIRARGAAPVLLTHAIRSAAPPSPEDREHLEGMRLFLPRATAGVILAFEKAAARRIAAYGQAHGIPVVDVDRRMSGRREWFADLVHFNDRGASVIAGLVADRVRDLGPATVTEPGRGRHAPGAAEGSGRPARGGSPGRPA